MLSDEEKKAIESLIEIREFANLSNYKDVKIDQLNAIDIVLNLIEKQQKEIEELKEKNKFLNWYFENQKENFIHKDKIKAKIGRIEDLHLSEDYKDYVISVLQSLLKGE